MSGNTTYMFTIQVNGATATASLNNVSNAAAGTTTMFEKMSGSIRRMGDCAFAFNNINQGLQNLSDKLDNAIAPGIALNTSLADLSAVTGVTGKGLKEIEGYARNTAKTFGGSAAQGVESYKLILSQLSPEIAKVPAALALMGEHIATTSKTMGGDTTAAAEVLTTAMNQFKVSLADPTQAAKVMGEMMNTMASAAQAGSAELPQIKAALEQSGMAAKMAGVSFAETNAAIQVLDKAGKKGSEGGVALRNVMATLGQGRFLPKDVQEELSAAGISINKLTDQSLSLSDRLKPLQGVMGDSALISKLFGKENNNAALALLSGLDAMDGYTSAIQGSNSAVEQAGVVMDSYAEKMSRQQAWIDDLKISLFNFTGGLMPYVKGVVAFFQGTASIMMGVNAMACFAESAWMVAIKARTKALYNGTKAVYSNISATVSSLIPMGIYSKMTYVSVVATYALSTAMKTLGKSIYGIPVIGWIAAGISLIVTTFKILWDKCEGFRRGIFAIWEVVKSVFYNIGVVVKAVFNNIIKPYFMFFWNIAKTVAGGIWAAMKWCWDSIVAGFTIVGGFFASLWDGMMSGASAVGEFFTGVWDWISGSCGGLASFISDTFSGIVEPIKAVFAPVWDFVSGIFNKMIEKAGKLFSWIGTLWNKLFPKNQFKDLGESAQTGLAKGSESWRKSQEQKKQPGMPDGGTPGVPDMPKNAVIPEAYGMGETSKKKAGTTKEKADTIDLNNVKGSTSYGAIAAKMAPVQISSLSGQKVTTTASITGATNNAAEKFNPAKQEYNEGKTGYLREIAMNVGKIAAGITLFASLASTGLAATAMPRVPSAYIPEVADIPGLTLPGSDRRAATAQSPARRNSGDRKEANAAPSFAKFCDQIVINVPAGVTDPQQIAECVKKEIMANLNNRFSDGY